MTYGIKLHVWGDYACFTRPEMKVERVSYDVMPPSAARGILEAIHWKPAVRWVIDRIHVLKPIRFENIRRNEVGAKVSDRNARAAERSGDLSSLGIDVTAERQQRAMLALRNVSYGIEAHFEMTPKAGPEDNPGKHREMFLRRAAKGQCFHRPCLGVREFAADFETVETFPETALPPGSRDLGWMLYDIDYTHGRRSMFFHAQMQDGVIDVAAAAREGLTA
ncbi:type I-C CRISPR-associated protein Cas5c [Pseudoruegeria sp. SK021]|uniref:type I-C CRISPR-associated protein Cas5c n=1 Tax=Pseudoruegeria sp. SK021 TaxID=1933035 RepID=UPI000A2187B2|nr:type I-C CRISPR-associated protein Cas5c [Pseudoruegeria sp. SK021]OSP53708.1 type I-C CRISPR-associated protein Cas5 [Pseudoruegeria sp. SK021]